MSLRDYGLPDGEVLGTPKWTKAGPEVPVCPNCKSIVCEVRVPMSMASMGIIAGMAKYYGCPACPWASPALLAKTTDAEG